MTQDVSAAFAPSFGRPHGRRPGGLGASGPGPGTGGLRRRGCPPRWRRAPIELTRVGKWIERVETLRLDGERPDVESPGGPPRVVLAAIADGPLRRLVRGVASARRVAAIAKTELGDRRPNAGGALAQDAALARWAQGLVGADRGDRGVRGRPAGGLRRRRSRGGPGSPSPIGASSSRGRTCAARPGERKATGLTGSLIAEPVAPPLPPTRVVRRRRRRRRGCPRRTARAETPSGGAARTATSAKAACRRRPIEAASARARWSRPRP